MSWVASQRVGEGSGPASHLFPPLIENRPSRASASRLRVVAFNAQGGVRFEGIVKCFRRPPLCDASVIFLCEADLGTRRAGGRRVAAELAAELGMSCAYVPEWGLRSPQGTIFAYLGNAILSVGPLEKVSAIPICYPHPRMRQLPRWLSGRGLTRIGGYAGIIAKTTLGGKSLHLCVVHLDSRCSPAGRARQMEGLMAGLSNDGPTILGGDFNTTTTDLLRPWSYVRTVGAMLVNPWRFRRPYRHEPLFEHLDRNQFEIRGANTEHPTFTFSRIVPVWNRPHLDWFALRGATPVPGTAAVVPARPSFLSSRVSDHDFIVVDVEL